jgi:hypothetical protein
VQALKNENDQPKALMAELSLKYRVLEFISEVIGRQNCTQCAAFAA